MKLARILSCLVTIALYLISAAQLARAQSTVKLSGTVPSESLRLPTYGDLEATQNLALQIWFKPRNQGELNTLAAAQQNPGSPQYHKWLTPQQYTARFGVTQEDFDKVSRWLTSEGFQVTGGSPAQGFVKFNGSVASISHTFNTAISKFSADGTKFANATDPLLPAEYGGLVSSITGLNNLFASKALTANPARPAEGAPAARSMLNPAPSLKEPLMLASLPAASPAVESPEVTIGGQTSLTPNDFYSFYDEGPLKTAGVTGTGCIAIVGDSDFNAAPIAAFNSQFGLPDNSGNIAKILVDGTSPGINSDEIETLVDLEWSHSVAPGAAIKYFLGNSSSSTNGPIVDAIQGAVTNGACGVISVSFSLCGGSSSFYTTTIGNIITQAQIQGQTILVSAGDDGAAGAVFNGASCVAGTTKNVNELASNPFIASVGGTAFNAGSFTSHTTERAWNDSDDPNGSFAGGGATGGGASIYFSKPTYQNGLTPNDNARDQPDVAFVASPNYPGAFVYQDPTTVGTNNCLQTSTGACLQVYGGTSLAAAAWAGVVDLLVQKSGANVGSINSQVYQSASAGQSAAGFYDITAGDNNFNGVAGFTAQAGYDQVTGWGTIDINNFVNAFVETPTGSSSALAAATAVPAATATATNTATPTPTPTPTPTATATPGPQAVVTVTKSGTGGGSPTNTVAGGTFTIANKTKSTQTINSVTINVSDPFVFSSFTLTATIGTTSSTSTPPATLKNTVFTFSPALSLPAGQSATFALSTVIALTPGMIDRPGVRFAYASIIPSAGNGTNGRSSGLGHLLLGLGLLGMCLAGTSERRRLKIAIFAAMLTVVAIGAAGCGGSSNSTPGGNGDGTFSSTQTVESASVTVGGVPQTVGGVPVKLGTITA